jgi:hypothetical protein
MFTAENLRIAKIPDFLMPHPKGAKGLFYFHDLLIQDEISQDFLASLHLNDEELEELKISANDWGIAKRNLLNCLERQSLSPLWHE